MTGNCTLLYSYIQHIPCFIIDQGALTYVDAAVPQYDMDKLTACKKLGATYLFVGDDWYGTEKWREYEKEFEEEGIKIVYFPYTKKISSTKITEALKQGMKDNVNVGEIK